MRECLAEEAVRYPIHLSSTLAAQLFLVRSNVLEESKAGVNVRSPRRRIKSTSRLLLATSSQVLLTCRLMADMVNCLASTLRIVVRLRVPLPSLHLRGRLPRTSGLSPRYSWLRSHHDLSYVRNWGTVAFGSLRASFSAHISNTCYLSHADARR